MSSIADFLFGGTAPPSVTTYGQTIQNIPTWLSDYTQGLIARANAIGAEPYQPYGGPRVAGATQDTQNAYDLTRQNIGMYNPTMGSAINHASGAPGASAPFVNAGSQALGMGADMTMGAGQAAQPNFNMANRNLGQAGRMTMGAVGPGQGGLAQAYPWLNAASGSFTGNVPGQYMDPYVGNVIDRATQLANRNFQENLMPGINDQFVAAGQPLSSRNAEMIGRAARDTTEGLQQTALGALSNAWQSGQGAYQADASRYAGLAGTAGQLGTAQQNAMLQAGQQLGALGQTYGTLGQMQGNLALGQGQQLGAIGQAYGNMGQQQGQLGLDAATNLGNLALAGQRMNAGDAASLSAIGADQQALQQRSLDTAYQDFQNQTNYPRQTIDWLSNIIRGLPTTTATNTATQSPGSNMSVSPLNQLASVYSAFNGIKNS